MKMCTANVKILIPGIPVTVIGAQLFWPLCNYNVA
jgi:hypothetical protein